MSDSPFIYLRNTVSGVSTGYTPEEAEQWLSHPVFGKVLEVVKSGKPEVIAPRGESKDDEPIETKDSK